MTTWTGATGSTDWFAVRHSDPNDPNSPLISNWSNSPGTPGTGDDIVIGSGFAVTNAFATVPSADPTFASLSIGNGSSVAGNQALNLTGNISNAGALQASAINTTGNISNSGMLQAGAIDMTGNISNSGAIQFGTVNFHSANVQWSGGGTINFSTPNIQINSATLTNDNIITGAFSLVGSLTNNGVVNANVANSRISLGLSSTVVNNKLVEATAPGSSVVFFTSSTIDNTGGGSLAAIGTGSGITFTAATVRGGTLHTNQSSTLTVANNTSGTNTIFDGTMTPINLDGNLDFAVGPVGPSSGSTTLTMQGTVNVSSNSVISMAAPSASLGNFGVFLVIKGTEVTFAAGSQITGNSSTSLSMIRGGASTDTLHSNGTIHGGIAISGLTVANSNTGTIDADSTVATSIAGSTIINSGLVEDTTAAGLLISSNTTIDGSGGGTLLATGAGTHVDLSSATIKAGTVQTTNGGVINITDQNVVFDGSASPLNVAAGTLIDIAASAALHPVGTIVNNGVLDLLTTSAQIVIDNGAATLTGDGSIVLGDSTGAGGGTIGGHGAGALNNISDTIGGFGTIGALTLFNQGLIDANVFGHTLNLATGVVITNDGTLAAHGGLLIVSDAVTGSGTAAIGNGGTIQFLVDFQENVSFHGTGSLQLPSVYQGTISGFGTQDSIDLSFLSWSSGDHAQWIENGSNTGGVLSILDSGGTMLASLNLAGTYRTESFRAADDGLGHVKVSDISSPQQPDFNADGYGDILWQNDNG